MFYVIDTHPLVWYLAKAKLPSKLDEIFKASERGECIIFIPTIVLAEFYYLSEKGKIELNFQNVLNAIEKSSNFLIVPLNVDVIKMFSNIAVKEIHDKIIIATAKLLNAKLITKDKEIMKSNDVDTIWD
ncbi:PIN domain-containing protein [Candidatus Woesearchaeota archaeon]|nr:PIN domain-containing protein [Candidatus Woesearchaeota archaeon]